MTTRKSDWKMQVRAMADEMSKWAKTDPNGRFQENYKDFNKMIDLVYNNKTKHETDLHGLTRYQAELLVKKLFYYLASLVGKKEDLIYYIIVGKGKHSPDGPQLQGKVKDMCEKDFNISVKFCPENTGVYEIRISPDAGSWMRMMRDIRKEVALLEKIDGDSKPMRRMLNGFSKEGFNPIILEHWDSDLNNKKLKRTVWNYIMNLASNKFLLAKEKSSLKKHNNRLLRNLNKLYRKKPKSLQELLPWGLDSERRLFIIYTFTKVNCKIDFNSFSEEKDVTEYLSPSEEKVEELLETDKNLFLRFDERNVADNSLKMPIYKKLQAIKDNIDTNKTHSKSIFLVIHLLDNSEKDSNFLPFDKNWEQYMIDSLIN